MKYNVGDVFLDDNARSVEKELDDESNYNFRIAMREAYDRGIQEINNYYLGLTEGKLYYPSFEHLCIYDKNEIAKLESKYGIRHSTFKFSYIKNDYYKSDYTEYINNHTGEYDVDIDINENGRGGGSIKPVIKTTEIKHHRVEVLGQRESTVWFDIPHWFEKPHKYSKQGTGCLYFLNRFDGFFEANNKKMSNGKLFHPTVIFIFSTLFLFASLALFFVSAYSTGLVEKIAFESSSLLSMIISFIFFCRLRIKKVDLPVVYSVFAIMEFVISILSFALLIATVVIPSFNYTFLEFMIASKCVPFVLWIFSLFFVHDSFEDYHDDQKAMYELNAFEKYPYFKEHYKEIIISKGPESKPVHKSPKNDDKPSSSIATPKKEYYCVIKEVSDDQTIRNKIVSLIIKEMDASPDYALKALFGKKTITLDTGMLIKKEFPSTKVMKYAR